MPSEQPTPNQGGAQPPRHSTSIDDVMGQQASGEHGTPTSTEAEWTSPAGPRTVAGSQPTDGAWQSAREVNKRTPRKRSFSADAPMWFGFGLILLLWGAIVLVDHFGPTNDLEARITDLDSSRSRKGGTSYTIEGIDSAGGEFKTDVTKSTYQRADRGDNVVVSRAWLTSRVVAIDGGGWRHDGGRMVWFSGIAFTAGSLLVIGGLVSMFRFAAADPNNPRPLRRVRWWLIVAGVLAAGWIVYERVDASASDSTSSSGTQGSSATIATTVPPARGSVECTNIGSTMGVLISALAADNTILESEVQQAINAVSAIHAECTQASVQAAACTALRETGVAGSTLFTTPEGLCVGTLP